MALFLVQLNLQLILPVDLHGADYGLVKLCTNTSSKNTKGLVRGHGLPVVPLGSQGIKDISYGNDFGHKGDGFTLQCPAIALTVNPFMVAGGNQGDFPIIRSKVHLFQDIIRACSVLLDLFILVTGQPSWFG